MKIDLANILERKFLLRKLEKEFQRTKISRFSGGSSLEWGYRFNSK